MMRKSFVDGKDGGWLLVRIDLYKFRVDGFDIFGFLVGLMLILV